MGEFDKRPRSRESGSALIQILAAIVLMTFVAGYVVPNIVRYPWHSIVFVVILAGLASATGASDRLADRLRESRHPAARRIMARARTAARIINGYPPYNEGRWWVVRSVVQAGFCCAVLGAALAVITAIGYVLTQFDTP